jgi:two-component system, cell cycle response regulator DivK
VSLTALIIDDNPENLSALALLLKKEGVMPVTVASPREVAGALDQYGQVDVVFLDLEFPNYNGLDLISTFQTDQRLQGIPFVAYTVHTSEQNEARDAGFHSFIGKPLNVGRFPDQLRRILNGERVWEAE